MPTPRSRRSHCGRTPARPLTSPGLDVTRAQTVRRRPYHAGVLGPDASAPLAYVDESFREHPDSGIYVLAAAVLTHSVQDEARTLMRKLRGRRNTSKLHWSQMDRGQRKAAASQLAAIEGLHLVAIGAPVPRRRQERARAACLTVLVLELHNLGVRHMFIEARTPELDLRDVRSVIGARYRLPKGAQLKIDHVRGSTDPLLWTADIVAGAVHASHDGNPTYRDILLERIYELRVAVA